MTEPRTAIYRGATRTDAERAYHAGARGAVDEGYVPASEDWSKALGQEVLTVGYVFAPDQAPAVLDALTTAERESRRAAMAPRVAPATPAEATPAQASEAVAKPGSRRLPIILVSVIILVLVLAWQQGLLSSLTSGGGSAGNIPPTGQMWFGTSFDPNTFAVSGRTSTTTKGTTVAAVATLPRSVSSGDINMRVSLDGTVIGVQQISMTGSGELFGVTLGPYFVGGAYKYDILDLGGNVLASGSLTVTE